MNPYAALLRSVSSLLVAFAACHGLAAKARENPLDRLTPVPADQPIPAIDFFRPPVFSRPELNPGGTHFAALVSTGADRLDLATFDLTTMKIDRLSGGKTTDVGAFEWLNDRRLLFSTAQDKLFAQGLYAVDIGRLDRINVLQVYNVVIPIGFPRNAPDHVIVWIRHSAFDYGDDLGVVRIDTTRESLPGGSAEIGTRRGITGKILRHYPVPSGVTVTAYAPGLDGELAFAIGTREGRWTLHAFANETWTATPVDLDAYSLVGLSDRPGELLVLGLRVEGKPRAVHRLDVATGALGEMVFSDNDYDLADIRIHRDPGDNRLLGVSFDRKGPETLWIDADHQAVHQAIQDMFPDQVVRIGGSDRSGAHYFFTTGSDRHPDTYYLFDKVNTQIKRITSTAPWIDPDRMRPMKLMSYKARDGRKIDGYLTLPAGASRETPPPLVVLPHGGPWVRDTWRWDPEVQFLASRGYAVFQPNYRGSPGTAWRFPEDDAWAFRKMHEDVTDGVAALVRAKLVDTRRIAIMGGSFGGYLAVSGLAFEPGLYRCGVTIAGVFDWERVLRESRYNVYQRGLHGTLLRRLGDPKKAQEAFESISPLRAVDKIKVPVFVAHGEEDMVASIAQSRRLIAELKKHGVAFEKQLERGQGHGFGQLEQRVELYERIEAFLRTHLAGPPAGS